MNLYLSNIIYNDVQESFGIGGPYLGYLNFKGINFKNKFVADSEKLSSDKSKIVLCMYKGSFKKSFFHSRKRIFKLIVIDEKEQLFYESINSYDALFIESFNQQKIVFYEAFHNGIEKYYREIFFSPENFIKISKSEI